VKEYTFTAKTVAWVDDGVLKKLIVHCHENDNCRLVIAFGKHQQRLVDSGLEVPIE
jgi:hypothetical protein